MSPTRWGGPADLQLRLLVEGLPQGGEAQALGLALYPNPASSAFNLRSETPIQRVELRNVLGQMVLSQNVQNTEALVSVEHLSNGTYYVRVYRDGTSADLKLIKQ